MKQTNEYALIEQGEKKTKKKIINKGTGAGGAKTNINGLTFEAKTSIEKKLEENKFIKCIINEKSKYGYYFEFNNDEKTIIYLTQSGFKIYFKNKFNINVYKYPDEAFIIIKNEKYNIKILEKKNQNVEGSVEDKLKTGQFNKREYELILIQKIESLFCKNKVSIDYAFCISNFLQKKFESNQEKYNNIKTIMMDDNIKIFYGDDDDYFDNIYKWIND
jgi:hypothetical protein